MVGAGTVVAHRLGRPGSQEHRAGIGDAIEQRARFARLHDQVFGRIGIGHRQRLGEIGHDQDAAVADGFLQDALARQRAALALELRRHRRGQLLRIGDQQRLRAHVMLGLRQQVGCDERRIRRRIGNHQHLGRSGRQVAGGAIRIAGHDLLGRRGERGARAEDLVHLGNGRGAIGHRRHRLRAAGLEHAVHAAAPRRHQHRRIGTPVGRRWRAQQALRAAGQLRRHRHHDHRGGQGRRTGRHIQAHGRYRAEHALAAHAGHHLHRQRRRQLRGMEAAHIVDGGLDGGGLLRIELTLGGVELLRRDLQ